MPKLKKNTRKSGEILTVGSQAQELFTDPWAIFQSNSKTWNRNITKCQFGHYLRNLFYKTVAAHTGGDQNRQSRVQLDKYVINYLVHYGRNIYFSVRVSGFLHIISVIHPNSYRNSLPSCYNECTLLQYWQRYWFMFVCVFFFLLNCHQFHVCSIPLGVLL